MEGEQELAKKIAAVQGSPDQKSAAALCENQQNKCGGSKPFGIPFWGRRIHHPFWSILVGIGMFTGGAGC